MIPKNLLITINNYRITIVSLIGVIIGFSLFFLSALLAPVTLTGILGTLLLYAQPLMRDFGSLIATTSGLALVSDFLLKRTFADEILAKVNLSRDIDDFGIRGATFDPTDRETGIKWKTLFQGSTELDIFFIHGLKWQLDNKDNLEEFCAYKGSRLRVILPDPNNQETLNGIAIATGKKVGNLERDINETMRFFKSFIKLGGADVYIRCTAVVPVYTLYRFGESAVVTFQSTQHKKSPVPHFLVTRGKKMYQFVENEFTSLFDRSTPV